MWAPVEDWGGAWGLLAGHSWPAVSCIGGWRGVEGGGGAVIAVRGLGRGLEPWQHLEAVTGISGPFSGVVCALCGFLFVFPGVVRAL